MKLSLPLKKKNTIFFLILILFLASFLRFWKLSLVPPGLFGDEVDTGYQAYSILKTGRDYFGNFLPVHFQSFGDWRVPLYIYLDTFFVAIFGLTELAVRLPSAIFGVLGVLLAFFLTRKITSDERVSLLSAFLLAVSPWHIQISRIGLEAILLLVLFPLGLIFFWKGLEEKKTLWFVLSGLSLGLTVYAYNTPKLFLPLILFVLLILWKKELFGNKKNLIVFVATLVIVFLPLVFDLFKGTSQARFLGISILSDETVAERVRLARQNCNYSGLPARILHNKATVWLDDFTKNYLSSVSTDFLFGVGDLNPRHSVGGRGELYLFELPFLFLGLGLAILKAFKEKNKIYQFLLAWLILTPLPAALTLNGGTHAIRLFLFLPWLQILTALGIFAAWNYLKPERFRFLYQVIVILVILVSVFLYLHQYFVHYPKISGRWWNYGYREIFKYINKNVSKYEKIYISSSWEPPIVYVLFYSSYPIEFAQRELTIYANGIGKYSFSPPKLSELIRNGSEPKTLYVLTPGELANTPYEVLSDLNIPSLKYINEIKAPDGTVPFVIFSSADVSISKACCSAIK